MPNWQDGVDDRVITEVRASGAEEFRERRMNGVQKVVNALVDREKGVDEQVSTNQFDSRGVPK